MTICKLPNERMNWVCEGKDLWAFRDEKGLYLIKKYEVEYAVVIRRDLVDSLCKNNAEYRRLASFGLQEFISGPHMHAVWYDGMRGLKL